MKLGAKERNPPTHSDLVKFNESLSLNHNPRRNAGAYPKSDRENITAEQTRVLRRLVDQHLEDHE